MLSKLIVGDGDGHVVTRLRMYKYARSEAARAPAVTSRAASPLASASQHRQDTGGPMRSTLQDESGEDDNMRPSSWLFVRGPESVRIIRASSGALIVSGPGHSQARRTFQDEPAMQAYCVDLAERLSAAGWLLWGEDHDRRRGTERRTMPRATADRRRGTALERSAPEPSLRDPRAVTPR